MAHYYSETQDSKFIPIEFDIRIEEITLSMSSGSGVFAKKKLDKGTSVFLKYLQIEDNSKILDLGCGIGVIGIYLKKKYPELNVFMSEINRRAFLLARKNAIKNDVEVNIIQSDGFLKIKKEDFDSILLNPPQLAGKKTCFRLITESFEHLKKGGNLQIVARHNKGGKSYSEYMREIFDNMKEIGIGSGYRVYKSVKKQEKLKNNIITNNNNKKLLG